MRTNLFIAALLLVLTIGGGIASAYVTKDVSIRYESASMELKAMVAAEMWDRTVDTASAYLESWEKTTYWLRALVDHDDIDNVTMALGRIRAGALAKDNSLCFEACSDLREHAEHLYHRDALTLGNVL